MRAIEDSTERKQAEEEICRRGALLEAANKELGASFSSISRNLCPPRRPLSGFMVLLPTRVVHSLRRRDRTGRRPMYDRMRRFENEEVP